MWPDLAIFYHFGKIVKDFGNLWMVYLLKENFEPSFVNSYPIGLIFFLVNGQILKKKSSCPVTLIPAVFLFVFVKQLYNFGNCVTKQVGR